MPLSETEIRRAAADLDTAERKREQIGLLSIRHEDMDIEDAYGIQAALVEAKLAAGRRRVGWKIGLTSKAMQEALGIDTPDSGVLLDDMQFEDGAAIAADCFIQPRIEAEIAFRMGHDLAGPGVGEFDVLDATALVFPALEILDTRIERSDPETGKARTIVDTIADNAANAGFVSGGLACKPDAVDLRWFGAIVSRNAKIERTGLAAGILNNPLKSVAWLANRLGEVGAGLKAGEIVLAGSFIAPIEIERGDTIHADFGPYGAIGCHFLRD